MRTVLVGVLAAGCLAGHAQAAPIQLSVKADGDPLRSVELVDQGSVTALAKLPDGRFQGTIEVESLKPQSHVVLIAYPDFRLPVQLRLHRYSKPVNIPVELARNRSCTSANVTAAGAMAATLPDAIANALRAARLLGITGNDSCDPQLASQAARALYDSTVRMNHLSNGLFAIPDEIADLYVARSLQPAEAQRIVAAYRRKAIGLEAVQLVAARDDAQKVGDFAVASSIQSALAETMSESAEAKVAFRDEGLTENRVAADSAYLEARAESERADEAEAERSP